MSAGATVSAFALTGLTACSEGVGGADSDFPAGGDLTLIAAGESGGGLDIQARMVEQSLMDEEDLSPVTPRIENIGGGGGNPARTAVLNRPNDGRSVVVESNRVFLSHLTGTTDMDEESFTAIAKLTTEYLVWAVPADSEWESAEDVLDELAEEPGSVSFGVGTLPSNDQFNIVRPAEEAGVEDPDDLNIVVFEEGGDLTANLVGGHVDIASTGYSEVADQVEAGEVRLLALSASADETVPDELADIPTWNDMELDYSVDHWRGVFGPADMPEDTLDWWVETLESVTQTDKWDELVTQYELTTDFEGPDEFAETIATQRAEAEAVLDGDED
ncbi:tripartite tricarboxylate transporter substrate binding protein [Spiractinospora alimapuensis]|uniref:tripartite tricarboxylate transporter substrate-binding protein n=1 Tax=Spiractinospora alimapuensis TaxID=2820884 RepID=UPI001F37D6DE|nr:tripartite tricarboxylate transporter substrate-binding protein [Spiractinospora alimapuensis]QVQ53726.1 tripartite tricarboxylate transporter substrate binding protein [Spiractinospora alimapuensis]